MTQWLSLPPELVEHIAKCVLSTSGVDEYMDMRAVCRSWRSAIPKPSPMVAFFYFYHETGKVAIYAGNVYLLNDQGTLCKIVRTGGQWYEEPIIETHMQESASDSCIYLEESAGKLLLVKVVPENDEVFCFDLERKLFEPVKKHRHPGARCHKCVSVDANKLPSIDDDCIYSAFAGFRPFTPEDIA